MLKQLCAARAEHHAKIESLRRVFSFLLLALVLLQGQAVPPAAPELLAARQALRQAKTPADFEAVRQTLQGLADSAKQRGDQPAEYDVLYTLGNALVGLNRSEDAIAVWERVLQYRRQTGNRFQQALTQHNLALRYSYLGESLRALPLFEELIAIRQDLKDEFGLAISYQALGNVYLSLGELANALEQYQGALARWEKLAQKQGLADTRNSIGYLYTLLGDTKRAEVELQRSAALWRELKSPSGEAFALNNLAVNALAQGNFAEAISLSSRVLPVFEESRDEPSQSYVLHNLGDAYAGLKKYQQASDYYLRSQQIKKRRSDSFGEAYSIHGQAEAEWALGRPAKARALLEQALDIRRGLAHRTGIIATLGTSARLEKAAKNLPAAKARIAEAVDLIEGLRRKLLSEDLRSTYFASQRDYYEFYIEVLLELKEPGAALEVAERARGKRLVDRLTETLVGLRKGVDASLLAEERQIQRRINSAAARLQRGAGANTKDLQQQITALLAEDRNLRERMRRSHPAYSALSAPATLRFSQMQAMLAPGEVLLHYFQGRERAYVWAVRAQALEWHPLQPLGQSIDWAESSRVLLQPVSRSLQGARRIIVSCDGMAESTPFAALPWNGAPLLAQSEIAFLPSLTALASQRAMAPAAPSAQNTLLVADPVYGPPDSRLALAPTSEAGALPRLRFTREEVTRISALLPPQQSKILWDFDASRESLLRQPLRDYQILHLATHTELNESQPALSGLVLSRFDPQGKSRDGLLLLPEIFNLDLRARLVVLSACRSALGPRVRGEGLEGLARGFLYAGAKTVLATLWDVDDHASSVLLAAFYKSLLQDKLSPPAALRAAQNTLRRDPAFGDPQYWAAYTLWGEWR
jgi:CHAT domain-containing protein